MFVQKPPSKTQLVYFMTTFFVWHVSQCHGEHVSYSQYSQNGWKALVFFFIHLSVTRLNQESTKYESKYLRSAVMISGIAVESSHAAHFTRSDSAHVGMLNFYVYILIWNTFFSLLFVFFSRENRILFWQNIFTHRKTFLCIVEVILESVLEHTKKSEGVMSLHVMRLYLYKVKLFDCKQVGFSRLFSKWN